MIFKNSDKDEAVVIVNCHCGCEESLHITKFDDPDIEHFYLTIHTSKFMNQKGIIRTILHRIKLAFMMLLGMEYRLTELVIDPAEMEELSKCLEEIRK